MYKRQAQIGGQRVQGLGLAAGLLVRIVDGATHLGGLAALSLIHISEPTRPY